MATIHVLSRQDRLELGFRSDRERPCSEQAISRRTEWELKTVQTPCPGMAADSQPAQASQRQRTVVSIAPMTEKKRLRVAAYCRVSTLMESQESSIQAQRAHYTALIGSKENWELAGIYLEAGVTGTRAEIRSELQRMMADCRARRIDLILTKSISRFSRNTSDCLELVRSLTALGVNIFFEKENIQTGSMESEFMLSILACLAEEESRSISDNMKWGLRKRFEAGTYRHSICPYGYKKDENGRLRVVPEQAAVIREIYGAVLSGCGMDAIARRLNERSIPSPFGKNWSQTTIRRLVHNPVYIGDLLCQKTFVNEHYCQRKNKGELDQYYDREHHEAIVSQEIFTLAVLATQQRGREHNTYTEEENPENARRRRSRYALSGRVFCAACGSVMYRSSQGQYPKISCAAKRRNRGGCSNGTEPEDSVKNAFLTMLNKLAYSQHLSPRNRVLDRYIGKLRAHEQEQNAQQLAEVDSALNQSQTKLDALMAVAMIGRPAEKEREQKATLLRVTCELRREKLQLETHPAMTHAAEKLKGFIDHWQPTGQTEAFPEDAFSEYVEKVELSSGVSVTFYLTCGLQLIETLRRDADV